MRLSRDGWAGLAVLAVSLVLFAMTLELKPSPLVPVGPGFYPRIVLGITAMFSALLVAFDFFSARKPPKLESANYAAVVLHFAVFGAYVLLLPELGFRVATFIYVAATNALMAPPLRPTQWLRVALLALGTMLVTYYVFEHYLTVLLPRGRWTGF